MIDEFYIDDDLAEIIENIDQPNIFTCYTPIKSKTDNKLKYLVLDFHDGDWETDDESWGTQIWDLSTLKKTENSPYTWDEYEVEGWTRSYYVDGLGETFNKIIADKREDLFFLTNKLGSELLKHI